MRKKLLTLMMAAVMAIGGMSLTAFADVESSSTVTKTVTGDNAPSETYSFTITATGYTDAPSSVDPQPEVTVESITTGTGSGSATLNLDAITEIGIYNYTITETIPTSKTAGITYDTATYTLKVTAYLDDSGELQKAVAIYDGSGDKVGNAAFTNTYTANTLTVTKEVTGNLGDSTKEFSFTVTFENTDSATTWVNDISATASGVTITGSGDTYTFTLTDGASAVFTNIPSGISYTVVENDANGDGYTTTYDGNEEGTMAGSDIATTVTNNKGTEVDTGVILDSLPYILILAVVLIGVVYLVLRRRTSDRY